MASQPHGRKFDVVGDAAGVGASEEGGNWRRYMARTPLEGDRIAVRVYPLPLSATKALTVPTFASTRDGWGSCRGGGGFRSGAWAPRATGPMRPKEVVSVNTEVVEVYNNGRGVPAWEGPRRGWHLVVATRRDGSRGVCPASPPWSRVTGTTIKSPGTIRRLREMRQRMDRVFTDHL